MHAAALPENFFTVWANVFLQGHLGKNESLLVHGGSSGIGLTAIQLAHEFAGSVYATAGSQEKCLACVKWGATAAINYREEDFESRIGNLTAGNGVDVILDMVGAPYFAGNMNCLATKGRLIEIATLQGAMVEGFDIRQMMAKRLTITGSTLRPRSAHEKGAIAASLLEKVWPILDQGRCKPVIYKALPLAEANEAHQLLESSQHIGKVILTMIN
jgi:NADPH2:quinone reductase